MTELELETIRDGIQRWPQNFTLLYFKSLYMYTLITLIFHDRTGIKKQLEWDSGASTPAAKPMEHKSFGLKVKLH